MENISQEHVIKLSLYNSIDREELLLKKYDEYITEIKTNELKEVLKEFKETSRKHIDLLKDKL